MRKFSALSILVILFTIHTLSLASSPIEKFVFANGTVSGTVLASGNGMAGILVELRRASDNEIVGGDISAADGSYAITAPAGTGAYYVKYTVPTNGFTIATPSSGQSAAFTVTDNQAVIGYNATLTPKPLTVTYCDRRPPSVLLQTTAWSDDFSLPKFDPALGLLSSVKLFATGVAFHPQGGVENTTPTSTSNYTLSFRAQLETTLPDGSAFIIQTKVDKSGTLSPYDGNTDFMGLRVIYTLKLSAPKRQR